MLHPPYHEIIRARTGSGTGDNLGVCRRSDAASVFPQDERHRPGEYRRRRWALAVALWVGLTYTRSSYGTGMGLSVVQSVPFSHQHHVGILGIDCRYCHTTVEHSSFAGMPPTKTCMNCHSQIWVGSPMLEPVRESYRTQSIAPLAAGL